MTHNLGRLVPDGRTVSNTSGLTLVPGPGPLGPPRFIILHFDNVNLSGGARLAVNLGYGTDEFAAGSGTDLWTRPIDASLGPIGISITGGTGSARLREFGSGEQSFSGGGPPGTPTGSQSNPDVFLKFLNASGQYFDPIFETRLECNAGFAWRNSACSLAPTIPDIVRQRVAAATGIIVVVHEGHVSSCSGTLIGPDLFLTARHCLTDPAGTDVRSSSVTFDYATDCSFAPPAGHATRFFKVIGEVVSGSAPTGSSPPVANDWVVLRLDAAPGALPAPLALRPAALMVGETIFTMHHPNGAAKKTQAGVHDGGSISGFDYAGGSSGSALFDINGQVVGGPLSAGAGCGVSYAPVAPIIAAIANPPPPPAPLDVMIVFDRSGSMASAAPPAGRTKLDEAQDAASLFVRLVREGAGDRLGLVTFSTMTDFVRLPQLAAAAKPVLVGPPPFTSGDIGAITPGGLTSIGAGLGNALLAFGSGSGNGRAILLLSDGLQNTAPMVEEIEGFLGTTQLNVIGFGSDAEINGPLLSRVAREHGGDFTRAIDGLSLRKFFGLSFGNIFEAGALGDPDHVLPGNRRESDPHTFNICGEERFTLVLGWDSPATPLRANIRRPSGQPVNLKLVDSERGRTWAFWRVPLPHEGEQDGTWQFTVSREPIIGAAPDEFHEGAAAAAGQGDVRYFYLIIADGGPKLTYLGGQRRVYTGDAIHPRVGLHYRDGKTPHATVNLTITAPQVALGQLVTDAGLRAPATTGDAIDAFHATLQAIAQQAGGALPIPMKTVTVPLYDDGIHEDGALEPDGVFNNPLIGLATVEGTYDFRAVATFGEGCAATREAHWSIHVVPGIDPGCTQVVLTGASVGPGGRMHGTLVIRPCDLYGNPLGPGRGDLFDVMPWPGVQVDGGLHDEKDGSYSVPVSWDPAVVGEPGVLVTQPDRPPVPVSPSGGAPGRPCRECDDAAQKLLDCLGLEGADVKRVRVKRISVDIDLDDADCGCGGKKRKRRNR